MDILKKNEWFFNAIANFYDATIGIWLYKIQIKAIKFTNPKENSKILDVGCGTGGLLEILNSKGKFELYGIDISEKMLNIAQKKLGKGTHLKIIQAENLNYRRKFDYIFSTESFHHFTNQEKAIQNMFNALKKKGKLVIVDLDFGKIFNYVFHMIEPGNSKMNSKRDLEKLFKQHNLKNITQKRIGSFAIFTRGEK